MAAIGNRTAITVWLLAVTAIGAGFFYFVNPAACPPCPFHALTGLNCPGCGATRAAHELLHGHIRAALHLNASLVLGVPVLLAIGLWQVLSLNGKPGQALTGSPHWAGLVLLLVLTFGIVRNIHFYPFTLLAP